MFHTNLEIIRKDEAAQLLGTSKTTLFEQQKIGLLPPHIQLGPRAVGFLKHEIQAIIAARAAGYGTEQIKEVVRNMVAKRKSMAQQLIAQSELLAHGGAKHV